MNVWQVNIIYHSVCYFFYKFGKKKRPTDDSQVQVDNQYASQQQEISCSNPISFNAVPYNKKASFTGSQDTVYEDCSNL